MHHSRPSAEHWIHLDSPNPIESTVATRAAAEEGSPRARDHELPGWPMAFKVIEAADRRAFNGWHLVDGVRAGAMFEKGVMVERTNQQGQEAAA